MARSPFDFINAINNKSSYLIESDADEKEYEPWMVNRGLSFTMDTILFANEMNKAYNMDKKLQHDFLYYGIPKGKRWGKWLKAEKIDDLDMISCFYGINKKVAATYMKLLEEEQISLIREKMSQGGKHGR